MCEYCGDAVRRAEGYSLDFPVDARPEFVEGRSTAAHLSLATVADFDLEGASDYVSELVDKAGGIGAWGILIEAFDYTSFETGATHCPMCGRELV